MRVVQDDACTFGRKFVRNAATDAGAGTRDKHAFV